MFRDLGVKKDSYKFARGFDDSFYSAYYMFSHFPDVKYTEIPGAYCDMCHTHHGSIVYHGKRRDYKFDYNY